MAAYVNGPIVMKFGTLNQTATVIKWSKSNF